MGRRAMSDVASVRAKENGRGVLPRHGRAGCEAGVVGDGVRACAATMVGQERLLAAGADVHADGDSVLLTARGAFRRSRRYLLRRV